MGDLYLDMSNLHDLGTQWFIGLSLFQKNSKTTRLNLKTTLLCFILHYVLVEEQHSFLHHFVNYSSLWHCSIIHSSFLCDSLFFLKPSLGSEKLEEPVKIESNKFTASDLPDPTVPNTLLISVLFGIRSKFKINVSILIILPMFNDGNVLRRSPIHHSIKNRTLRPHTYRVSPCLEKCSEVGHASWRREACSVNTPVSDEYCSLNTQWSQGH